MQLFPFLKLYQSNDKYPQSSQTYRVVQTCPSAGIYQQPQPYTKVYSADEYGFEILFSEAIKELLTLVLIVALLINHKWEQEERNCEISPRVPGERLGTHISHQPARHKGRKDTIYEEDRPGKQRTNFNCLMKVFVISVKLLDTGNILGSIFGSGNFELFRVIIALGDKEHAIHAAGQRHPSDGRLAIVIGRILVFHVYLDDLNNIIRTVKADFKQGIPQLFINIFQILFIGKTQNWLKVYDKKYIHLQSYNQMIAIFLFILAVLAQDTPQHQPIHIILTEFAAEIKDWVGFDTNVLDKAAQCNLPAVQEQLLDFHGKLAREGSQFSRGHIDLIRKQFKEHPQTKQFFKCLVEKRNTQNHFFKERKKYKYLAQFIKEYPRFAVETFEVTDKPFDKGYRLGRFFRAFFEYYYQYVLNPAETISTKVFRALTPKIDIFEHEDISPCVALETSGKISESLQNLSIHNIYINIPEAFNALKYLKLKDKCRSQKNLKMVSKLTDRLAGIDMFKIMYSQYTPFVQIAAQKYGNYQIETLAAIFANIIMKPEYYRKLSEEQL